MKISMLSIVSVGLLLMALGSWGEAALPPKPDLEAKAFLEGEKSFGWYVKTLAFSPDSKLLASTSNPKEGVCLWDVDSGKLVATLKHRGAEQLAFSPDGKVLATADRTIKLWDVATRKQRGTLEGDQLVRWMVFSADGKKLAALAADVLGACRKKSKRLTVWSVEKQKELHSEELSDPLALVSAYPSVKRPLLTGRPGGIASPTARDNPFKLNDVFTDELVLACDGHPRAEFGFGTISMDREETVVASQGMSGAPPGREIVVRLWDRTSGEEITAFRVEGGGILSPDAKIFATRSAGGATQPEEGIRLYEVASGELLTASKGSEYGLYGPFAFSPDGRVFAAAIRQNIRLWTVPDAWRKKKK